MSEVPRPTDGTELQRADFDRITEMVSAEFQVEQSLLDQGVPTYYLTQPQETKQAFVRLLEKLRAMNLIALLRKTRGKVILRVVSRPQAKPSNVLVNWILFFATMVTTFITGYLLSGEMLNPILGGVTFMAAILAVLGAHEMSHKLSANRHGIDATPPYFIPGPPPLIGGVGTFGAVIMQKSLPPNRDSLFDVGASGPLIGFIIAAIVTAIGLPFSTYSLASEGISTLPVPILFRLLGTVLLPSGAPTAGPGQIVVISLHPLAVAGWVGLIVTMLNLLPAAMLDGGHVSRSIAGNVTRTALTLVSIVFLVVEGFWPMAIFVVFLASYKHPGPLDDVSGLSIGRKLLTVGLIAVFVLCSYPPTASLF